MSVRGEVLRCRRRNKACVGRFKVCRKACARRHKSPEAARLVGFQLGKLRVLDQRGVVGHLQQCPQRGT